MAVLHLDPQAAFEAAWRIILDTGEKEGVYFGEPADNELVTAYAASLGLDDAAEMLPYVRAWRLREEHADHMHGDPL